MKERILAYMKSVDLFLWEDRKKREADYEKLMKEHLIQLGFFMHERQVHLFVMLLFALLAFGDFFMMVISFQKGLVLLFLALLVLLIPYIMHYYLLENSCQYMYLQYDEMKRRMGDAGDLEFYKKEHPYRYLPAHLLKEAEEEQKSGEEQ